MKTYLVRGYHSFGFASVKVNATNEHQAFAKAKHELADITGYPVSVFTSFEVVDSWTIA